ncbi:MAG: AbrB/MazE/SpoVT family DNA-binding domain-containing protein [Pseudomonadota bacterium]
MRISKWGDSLVVQLPKQLVEQPGLKEGDDVDVTSADGRTIVIAKSDADDKRAEFLKQMEQFHWPASEDENGFIDKLRSVQKPAPADFVWNRDDANTR